MTKADRRRARRTRLLALHRWAGLLAGLLMCPVFLWGTLAVWEPELDLWMRPAITTPAGAADTVRAAALAEALLRAGARPSDTWRVALPGPRSAATVLEWCGAGACRREVVDGGTGARTRPTAGGALFATLHFALAAGRSGEILVGLAGLHVLAVIASGVWIHLRRLLPDLFRLRLEAQAAKRLRDAHVLTAVATLPFMTVATYSGVLLFAFLTLPAAWQVRYGADRAAFFAEREGAPLGTAPRPASAPARDALGLAHAVRLAETVLGRGKAGWIAAPATGAVEIIERDGATLPLRRRRVAVAADGSLAADPPAAPAAEARLERWFFGVHFARWGGTGIRALYTVNGLLATGAIAFALFLPGLRARRGGGAWPRVERAAAIVATAGLVPATAAPLWVDRLLPREAAAVPLDAGAVAVTLVLAAVVAARVRAPARVLLAGGAAATLALPLLDVATAPAGAPLAGARAAVDAAALTTGAACLLLVVATGRRA